MKKDYEKAAKLFVKAIQRLAQNPGQLENFEYYLQTHFDSWLKKYANTPENITYELIHFANMEI